jgi:hypothetical protein
MSLLENSTKKQDESSTIFSTVEKTIPVLDILRRAGSPERNLQYVYDNVLRHLDSRSWHVRELAARTLCALSPANQWKLVIGQLEALSKNSANRRHGVLIAITHIIARQIRSSRSAEAGTFRDIRSTSTSTNKEPDFVEELCIVFNEHFSGDFSVQNSPSVLAAYLDAGTMVIRAILSKTAGMTLAPDDISGHTQSLEPRAIGQQRMADIISATFPAHTYTETLSTVKLWQSTVGLSFHAIIRRVIYYSAIRGHVNGIIDVVLYALSRSASAALIAIETTHDVWEINKRKEDRSVFFRLYSDVIKSSTVTSVRAMGLCYLTDLLDMFTDAELENAGKEVLAIGQLSYSRPRSPELSIAWIRFSGFQAHIAGLGDFEFKDALQRWGLAIVDCLKDEKVT